MQISEVKFILANTPTFNRLKEEAIDELISIAKIEEYKNGEIIYRQNDPPDYFYFLLKGRVVALTLQGDREVEIDLLKRGTSFGIISIFTDEPHSITTKSIETSFILKIEKEKFKKFLDTHPLILLDFSRMLSQRVRAEVHPKRIFQFKRIAILGFSSSGKTTYMYELGKVLKEVSNKKVICVEISLTNNFTLPYLINSQCKALKSFEFREENVLEFIVRGENDYLLLELKENALPSAILNFLSENYHFILYELPSYLLDKSLEQVIANSDYIHFVVFSQIEEMRKGGLFIEEAISKNLTTKDKIKVILNEYGARDNLSYIEKCNILKNSIYATLPHYQDQNYHKATRRIARQIAEVVVGIALGSGAAYGFSHIGVLEVLRENKINIDMICGSSMGAFIATLWALDYDNEQIIRLAKEFIRRITYFSIFGLSFPFKGIIKAQHLEYVFKKIFNNKTFYDVKHVLKIVAFDFSKKEIAVLEKGPLYKAVAASCAMPGIFEPVRVKEELLLDGGILNPLPTKILLNYGANKIIAVNITPSREEIYKEYKKIKKPHVFDFIFGSIETMQRQFVLQALNITDVVIHPNFEGLGWMEFDKIEEFIKRGRISAEEKLPELRNLI